MNKDDLANQTHNWHVRQLSRILLGVAVVCVVVAYFFP